MESSICLQRSDSDLREFIIAVIAVEVFMLAFFLECKVYDLSTAMFVAFGLGLLARGRLKEYYLLFPIGCLNRETMFLLIILFMVYFVKRLEIRDWVGGVVYQCCVFIMIRLYLMAIYADNAGMPFVFRVWENAADHMKYPWRSLVFFAGVLIITWLCMRNWQEKPIFLRTAFVVFAPSLMFLYILFGWAFEIRVFAEVYPVVWVLLTSTLPWDI